LFFPKAQKRFILQPPIQRVVILQRKNEIMDTFSPKERSWIMAQVKSSGNKSTEARLIDVFHEQGFTGWRRGYPLFGNPDFVFLKKRVAIFVDGCFWHGHPSKCRVPKTNREYWLKKIGRNVKRDRLVTRALREKGWKVIRIWEDSVKKSTTASRIREVLS
jgi:DNA mismatch endonuclease, patch repair protein